MNVQDLRQAVKEGEVHSAQEIRIGRLERKLEKVKHQRDHYKELYEHYAKVISMQPHIEKRWENYQKRRAQEQHQKNIEKRVEEQETLIRILLRDDPLRNYEIDKLYSNLIKEEYRKMNDAKTN